MLNLKISVIGLGHLGQPMAYVYASKGYNVIGVDKNEALIQSLRDGQDPIYEPFLSELRNENKSRVELSTDTKYAVLNSDITFIIVPTPSKPNGAFTNEYVINVLKDIGKALRKKNDYHLVVVTSTVMPGSCAEVFKPMLEKISKKECGKDFGLCYNPEFIALGSVIHDLLNPDALLIGESDDFAGAKLVLFLKSICDNNSSVHRMNFYNAELSKISLNTFLTTKISLANTYADMCERMPGGDVEVVTNFLGSDLRVGHKFLKGGLGYSGPCLPRDNRAFITLAKKYGAECMIQKATDKTNDYQKERIWWMIKEWFGIAKGYEFSDKVIGILGMSFKPGTTVITESPVLPVIEKIIKYGAKVKVYDPSQFRMVKWPFDDKVAYVKDMQTCIDDSNAVLIMTPWDEFKELSSVNFKKRVFLLDCWRILDYNTLGNNVIYRTLGVHYK